MSNANKQVIIRQYNGDFTMNYFYARVSTKDQNLDRQLKSAKEQNIPIENIYTDKLSGKNTKRPGWSQLNKAMTKGDVLVVSSMSRISRSLKDIISIISDLTERGIGINMLKENIDTTTKAGRLMSGVLGSVYEFEREMIVERVTEGVNVSISSRKQNKTLNGSGHTWGGNKSKKLTIDQKSILTLWTNNKLSTDQAKKSLSCSRASLYNLKKKLVI